MRLIPTIDIGQLLTALSNAGYPVPTLDQIIANLTDEQKAALRDSLRETLKHFIVIPPQG